MPWQIYTLLAVIIWGFWGFFPKLASMNTSPQSAWVWSGIDGTLATITIFLPKGTLYPAITILLTFTTIVLFSS